jgi:hypothetical protein
MAHFTALIVFSYYEFLISSHFSSLIIVFLAMIAFGHWSCLNRAPDGELPPAVTTGVGLTSYSPPAHILWRVLFAGGYPSQRDKEGTQTCKGDGIQQDPLTYQMLHGWNIGLVGGREALSEICRGVLASSRTNRSVSSHGVGNDTRPDKAFDLGMKI